MWRAWQWSSIPPFRLSGARSKIWSATLLAGLSGWLTVGCASRSAGPVSSTSKASAPQSDQGAKHPPSNTRNDALTPTSPTTDATTAASAAPNAATTAAAAAARKPRDSITLFVAGDVGLNRNNYPVFPDGLHDGGTVQTWAEMSAGIAPLVDADLNFLNLETVVTDRNDLIPGAKGQKTPYLFRTHPDGVAHLIGLGFNLFSGANNHAFDYGEDGILDTLRHFAALAERAARPVFLTGIGANREIASRPATFWLDDAQIAFSSIGIVTNMIDAHRATDEKAGTMGYRHDEDWQIVTSRLSRAPAQLRILSVHYGIERNIRTDERQRREFRGAIAAKAADVIIGHHAHVARGVELLDDSVIFYGLGNFLIRGAANMGAQKVLSICCDFGLAAKVHYRRRPDRRFVAVAVEVFPLTDMHYAPRPMSPTDGATRVLVLNVLAEGLDDNKTGSVGVRFWARPDGSGLYCSPEAAKGSDRASSLCHNYPGPTPATKLVRARVKAAPNP